MPDNEPAAADTASADGLRIAILAPISWRVPPRHYGPWEQFVSLLTEGLVRRGVDVTLFATADSVTGARLVATAPTGYSEDPGLSAKVWEALHISALFERAGEFDVIHNSFDFLPLTYSDLVETPVVTTIHGFSSEEIVPVFEKYNARGYYVAISDSDRHERLDYVATIHHGIDMDEFEPGAGPGDYLLFFGRIHPEKGTAEAMPGVGEQCLDGAALERVVHHRDPVGRGQIADHAGDRSAEPLEVLGGFGQRNVVCGHDEIEASFGRAFGQFAADA